MPVVSALKQTAMLNTKSFLAVDFGAGSLKLAEFETNEAGGLLLRNFSITALGLEGAQEATRESVVLKALQDTLAEKDIKAKNVNVCAPGFQVFSKFVKLPPVDAAKVTQIIQYEAQQNVPFPLAEVVWDYQILGSAASGELEVLLVAIKSEVVEGLFRVAEKARLKLNLCDASSAALCNAFRFNYGDLEDCTIETRLSPQTTAVGLNNRATDRQSHPDALRFGRKERFKDTVYLIRVETNSGVANLNQHAITAICRFDYKFPGSTDIGVHSIDAVHGQVDYYLLQLHSITHYTRQVNAEIEPHMDMIACCLVTHHKRRFSNHIIDIQFDPVRKVLLHERPYSRNDVLDPEGVLRNFCNSFLYFVQIR